MFLLAVSLPTLAANTSNPGTQNGPFGYQCELGQEVATQDLWTPIILLNSPYDGSASGSSSTTTTTQYAFHSGDVSLQTSTSTTSSGQLGDNNGAASGYFELDEWAIYSTHNVVSGENAPCTQSYVAEIVSKGLGILTEPLMSSGSTSDSGEPTSLDSSPYNCPSGYCSITFSNGYSSETAPYYNCAPPSWSSTSTTTVTSVSVTVSISGYATSGTMGETTSATNSFTYNFPRVGTWYYQTLDGSYNSGAWAFSYVGSSC